MLIYFHFICMTWVWILACFNSGVSSWKKLGPLTTGKSVYLRFLSLRHPHPSTSSQLPLSPTIISDNQETAVPKATGTGYSQTALSANRLSAEAHGTQAEGLAAMQPGGGSSWRPAPHTALDLYQCHN